MTLVVQKFGGTSVGDPERIRNVARRVVSTAESGAEVCVAVSAMGRTTDELLALAGQVSERPQPREPTQCQPAHRRRKSVAHNPIQTTSTKCQ